MYGFLVSLRRQKALCFPLCPEFAAFSTNTCTTLIHWSRLGLFSLCFCVFVELETVQTWCEIEIHVSKVSFGYTLKQMWPT